MTTDWGQIKAEYVNGLADYAELAKKYGLLPNTVAQHGSRGKWPEERERLTNEVIASVSRVLAEKRMLLLTELNEQDVTAAKKIKKRALDFLRDGFKLTATDLKMVASAIEIAQRVGRLALGVTSTLEELQIAKIRKELGDDGETATPESITCTVVDASLPEEAEQSDEDEE